MTRRYGRKIPAPLPPHRMLSRVSPALPSAVDTRANCGPVKDQGSEGSCTAHAGTSAAEWIFRKYFLKFPIFSPQYTYAKELIAQGSFPNDVGSDGVTLCNTLIANGCCELPLYPYTAGDIEMPTVAQDSNAALWRLGAYHGLTSSQVALSVLGDPVPWPVEIGFTVYESFESDAVAQNGIYNPSSGESALGGHEVLMVGYDVGDTPTLRPATCPPAALIQNSWGMDWGAAGFFWMAIPVLDAPDTDLKIAHSGSPWA
jgi:Papain family cysteine protease